LENDSNEDELELTSGSDDDTNDDKRDISESPEIGRCESEDPTSEEDCDRSRGLHSWLVWLKLANKRFLFANLEHLNEGDTEI